MTPAYQALLKRLRESATLESVAGLLRWDQETMMPPGAGTFRAEELALIGRLAHDRATAPSVGALLDECEADPDLSSDPAAAANLREARRTFDRASRVPADLVAEMLSTSSMALQAWKQARRNNDFEVVQPWLEKQFLLLRRQGECLRVEPGAEVYDALLQEYEPEMTAAGLEKIFRPFRSELKELIGDVTCGAVVPDQSVLHERLAVSVQKRMNAWILEHIGFDRSSGRFDESIHPFVIAVGQGDTRVTNRYREDRFADALTATLHEAGHALYEQGLPKDERFGEPVARSLGPAVHESQSRLWENQIGRSRGFWEWLLPEARRRFGLTLDPYSSEDVYRALNTVNPALIRVNSDEATYNLHIMIRFELERAMIGGDLRVADLPEAWSESMQRELGLDVPDHAHGCLQDMHWALGAIGYFPTYAIGNLYAGQFWEKLNQDLPDIEARIARGEFSVLLSWLRQTVHARGRFVTAPELCREVTGKPLDHGPLMRYLDEKLRRVHQLGLCSTRS